MKQNKILLRDFLIVNLVCGIAAFMMLLVMLLQRIHVLPAIPCGLMVLFHIYCPGCGGTRALYSMLQGRFLESLFYNPAVLLGTLLIIYYEVSVIITLVKDNGKIYYYRKPGLIYVYLAVVFGYAVIRDVLLFIPGIDLLGDLL